MPQTVIESLAAFEQALSSNPRLMLFKHSPTCPISVAALEQWELFRSEHPDAPTLFVDVIASRSVARAVAEACGVTHQSPQAILFVRGVPVWNKSHGDVTRHALHTAWSTA